ncbi:MAG: adenosylcobinamide-GDP ribazoletransferase [Deltaproteobacteria bacterium]|nr:adenosylcobinamide-GDP ribazoletransferase [Deltaproteobacteria bacterium]
MLRQFITAWQFLTIIPISRRIEVTAESLGRSMAVFPLVGLALGGILIALDYGFAHIFPPAIVSALLFTSYIAMYGGFHLDGLADTIDGLAGGKDREHALKIMKDSNIGAIGVVVLVLLLLLKYTAIDSLPDGLRWEGLLIMPVIGRWTQVWMTYGSRYARENGLGRPFVEYVKERELVIASLITIVVSWLTLGVKGLLAVITTALIGLILKRFFDKKIGGITGDILGAGGEICELIMLLVIIAIV